MAGVTAVGVRPTSRRRGLLTSLMRAQLEALRDGGEAIAGLWASEARIYGRFGYGLATRVAQLEVRTERAALLPGLDAGGLVADQLRPEDARAGPAGGPRRRPPRAARAAGPRRAALGPPARRPRGRPRRGQAAARGRRPRRRGRAAGLRGLRRARGRRRDRPGRRGARAGGARRDHRPRASRCGSSSWAWTSSAGCGGPTARPTWASASCWPTRAPRAPSSATGCGCGSSTSTARWPRAATRPRSTSSSTSTTRGCPPTPGATAWRAARGGGVRPDHRRARPPPATDTLAAAFLGGPPLRALADAGRVQELTPGAVDAATTAFRSPREPWCPDVF